MRRGPVPTYDAMARPTYKSVAPASASTTPRSQRSTTSRPRAASNGTILVNLDVFIHRATIGRDISPADEDLIVLFRRNSKEITSEPTRWGADHVAVWSQHVGIQTSLLRHKKPPSPASGANAPVPAEFLKKDYEVVLVALPSHSAVALFSLDFAEIVHPSTAPRERHKSFRISPLKCRDLAATLELDISWDFAQPPSSSPPPASVPNAGMGLNGLPPSSTLLSKAVSAANVPTKPGKSSTKKAGAGKSSQQSRQHTDTTSSSVSSRRTTASVSSQGSERDLLEELESNSRGCSTCRAAKRRLERKDVQVLQLETFLKESQKRLDSLMLENEELTQRERAETSNAQRQRALNLRLLQELETAFQFCASQMQSGASATNPSAADAAAFRFLPQFEFMDRVKKLHAALDPLTQDSSSRAGSELSQTSTASPVLDLDSFDWQAELDATMQRNRQLQRQLEVLGRSLAYDEVCDGTTRSVRATTDASGATSSSDRSRGSVGDGQSDARPVALTMTQQLNNLERENFQLRAKLEEALANSASASASHSAGKVLGRSGSSTADAPEVSETTSSSSREELDEPETEDAALALGRIHELELEAQGERAAALEAQLSSAQQEILDLQHKLATEAHGRRLSNTKPTESEEPTAAAAAPGFLDKIYADVGKAKQVLEERVAQLNALLAEAADENARLRVELETMQGQQTQLEQQQSLGIEADVETLAAKMELEKRVKALEEELRVRDKDGEVRGALLAGAKEQREAAETRANAAEQTASEAQSELASAQLALKMAQEFAAQLEEQVATLTAAGSGAGAGAATTGHSIVSQTSMASEAPARDEELADALKQLKLAKQEVMQLRYRSNQLESVHERLEEALKAKRALEVKLTALEGQLYEHRSRTISDNSFSSAALASADAKSSALMTGMQRELDQKAAQLVIAERELERLRGNGGGFSSINVSAGGSTGSGLEDVVDKVARFEAEISQLCQRNDEQARKLERLGARVTVAVRERDELEAIVQQMVQEMALLEHGGGDSSGGAESGLPGAIPVRSHRTPSIPEAGEVDFQVEDKPRTPGKLAARYTQAVASSSGPGTPTRSPMRSPVSSGGGKSSKVAQLMKNFSNVDSSSESGDDAVSPGGGVAFKRPTKMDFRNRNGSSASNSSSRFRRSPSATAQRF